MKQRRGYSRKERTTEVGNYLTSLRISQGLNQKRVAGMLGMSKSYICQIERGKRSPPAHILRHLAGIYGVLPEEVFRKAHLLELPLLNAIIAPEEVSIDLQKDTSEEERRELRRYLAFLRLRHRS